jgi:hypothetical protein
MMIAAGSSSFPPPVAPVLHASVGAEVAPVSHPKDEVRNQQVENPGKGITEANALKY